MLLGAASDVFDRSTTGDREVIGTAALVNGLPGLLGVASGPNASVSRTLPPSCLLSTPIRLPLRSPLSCTSATDVSIRDITRCRTQGGGNLTVREGMEDEGTPLTPGSP